MNKFKILLTILIIILVIIASILAILLIMDVVSSSDAIEMITKSLQVTGVLVVASTIIMFVLAQSKSS
jgi:hypothetical protein